MSQHCLLIPVETGWFTRHPLIFRSTKDSRGLVICWVISWAQITPSPWRSLPPCSLTWLCCPIIIISMQYYACSGLRSPCLQALIPLKIQNCNMGPGDHRNTQIVQVWKLCRYWRIWSSCNYSLALHLQLCTSTDSADKVSWVLNVQHPLIRSSISAMLSRPLANTRISWQCTL